MADDQTDETLISTRELDEATAEFQPDPEIMALRDRLLRKQRGGDDRYDNADETLIRPSLEPPRPTPRAALRRPPRDEPPARHQQQPPRAQPVAPRRSAAQIPPDFNPDQTRLTPPEPSGAHSYNQLVPRSDGPKAPTTRSVDETVIGYASSVTGFHELDVIGRSVPLRRPRRLAFTIAMVVGVLSSAALAMTILQSWTPPDRAWVLAATMMAFATTLTTFFCAGIWQNAKRGAVVGIAMGILGSFGGVLVAAAWSTDTTRARVVDGWTGYNATLHLALEDRSVLVRSKACEKIIRRDDNVGRVLLLPMLTLAPRVAADCLSATAGFETSQTLARTIAQRWDKELVSDVETPPDHFIHLPEAIAQLPLSQAERDRVLLHCVFGSSVDDARQRCAEVVGAAKGDWPARLSELSTIEVSGVTSRGVIAMALNSPRLRAEQQKLRQLLSADSPEAHWAALRLAQGAIMNGSTNSTLEFAASLERDCSIDTSNLPTSRDTWFNVLSIALELRKDFPKPTDAMCRSVIQTFLRSAVDTASSLVAVSARASGRKRAREIDRGWLMINKHNPQTESDLRAMIPSNVSEADAQKMMQMYSQGPEGQSHPLFLGDPAR